MSDVPEVESAVTVEQIHANAEAPYLILAANARELGDEAMQFRLAYAGRKAADTAARKWEFEQLGFDIRSLDSTDIERVKHDDVEHALDIACAEAFSPKLYYGPRKLGREMFYGYWSTTWGYLSDIIPKEVQKTEQIKALLGARLRGQFPVYKGEIKDQDHYRGEATEWDTDIGVLLRIHERKDHMNRIRISAVHPSQLEKVQLGVPPAEAGSLF